MAASIGDFKDDKLNGLGTYYNPDGSYYQGEFANDKPHGYGRLFDKNGKLLGEGNWENGVYKGK